MKALGGKKQQEEELKEMALRAFSNHEITHKGLDRWRCRNPEKSEHWFEVAILANGTLIVHGDISTAVFGRFSGAEYKLLDWVAGMHDSLGYAREKISIGMGAPLGEEYDPEAARHDLKALAQVCAEEYEEDGEYELERLLEDIEPFNNRSNLLDDIYHATGTMHDTIGMRTTQRVVYAVYAVKKLVELLKRSKWIRIT